MPDIFSPLLENEACLVEEVIESNKVICRYQELFNIDVKKFFESHSSIYLCRCPKTQYRFYFPFTLSGDGGFYAHLQKSEWYYMPWKWEHHVTSGMIEKHEKILEIGCGDGSFVERLHKNGFDITGLELNEEAVLSAQKKELRVLDETIQKHHEKFRGAYDLVCNFQVLEHITNPKSFLEASLGCLKSNGRLIICVPNNDSFIKFVKMLVINMPPHHMGLWNATSLKNLQKILPITLNSLRYEPLQHYHFDLYLSTIRHRFFSSGIMKKLYNKLKFHFFLKGIIKIFRPYVRGHSIMAIYTKN